MGYRGHDDWRDMSDFVVHFTKPPELKDIPPKQRPKREGRRTLSELLHAIGRERMKDRSGHYPWITILGSGELQPGPAPLGAARKIRELRDSQRVVCFSEIP